MRGVVDAIVSAVTEIQYFHLQLSLISCKKSKEKKTKKIKMRETENEDGKKDKLKSQILNCYFLQLHVQRARELLLFLRDYVR